jgi:5S rRNA maturation endonuclease (ribonuclease M5)
MDDRFAPLTEAERCSRPQWTPVVPVPQGIRLPDDLVKRCCPPGHFLRAAWRYRTPEGGLSSLVVRYNETCSDRKQFKPFTYCQNQVGRREWRCQAVPEPRPLFNLDQLAARPDAQVLISEGERSANKAARIFPKSVCITSPGGSQAASKADWSPLAGRRVMIWPDADEPGEKYRDDVAAVLHGQNCEVSTIDAVALASIDPNGGQREPEEGWDAAKAAEEWPDMVALRKAAHGLAKPFEADAAKPNGGAPGFPDDKAEISRLAKLSLLDYDRERIDAAGKLGCRVQTLDGEVAKARGYGDSPPGQGRTLEFPEPEPWPEPVDGAELLDEIEAVFSRFAVCETAARDALVLWCCATWFEPVAQVAPILNITSPEMRCGKSLVLSIAAKLSKRLLPSSNISAAALFRTIEKHSPTLIVDEADSFLGENEELRGLINSGHTRDTAFVIKTVGDDHEPKQFSTWGFKAIAGIGKRAATIEDRSNYHIHQTEAPRRKGRTAALRQSGAIRDAGTQACPLRERHHGGRRGREAALARSAKRPRTR